MALVMKLSADPREPRKKGGARQVRREGRIPCVVYAHGEPAVPLSIDYREFDAMLRSREGTVIIDLVTGTQDVQKAIIREIQRDPVSGKVLHVDLQEISMTEMVQVEVPLVVIGTAFGVKTEGGMMEHHLRTIDVKCLPTQIPSRVEVDVTELKIGGSVKVEELPIDRENIEVVTDPRAVIITVIPPRVIKTAEEEAAEAAEAAEEAAEGAEEGAEGDKKAEGDKSGES
jgi:large subunit ribosomal protein L25